MHGSRSDLADVATPAVAPSGPSEEVDHDSGGVEREHGPTVPPRFGVESDESVEVVVRPESDDFWWTTGVVTAVVWVPGFLTWLVRLGSDDPMFGIALLAWGVLAGVFGLATGVVSLIGGPELVATDRGLRVARRKEGPVLIPWEDVLSIEPTFPYVAKFRIELRRDSPALDELAKPSWIERIWTRSGDGRRLVGSEQIWDIRSWRLEALQDALDRHAVRAFRAELDRERDRAALLASGEPADLDHDPHSDEEER